MTSGKDSSETVRETSGFARRASVRAGIGAVAAVIVVAVTWCGLWVRCRHSIDVGRFVSGVDKDLTIAHTIELVDRAGGGQPFEGFALDRDGEEGGTVYTFTIPNVAAGCVGRLTGSLKTVNVAVYIDELNFIRRVGCIQPVHPLLFDSALAAYLARWTDVPANNAMWDNPAVDFGAGGGLGPSIRSRIRDLTAGIFIERYGFDRYMSDLILKGARGLKAGEPLPNFSGVTLDGSVVSTDGARGRKLVIMASQPTCGSCFDATVLTMGQAASSDVERIVLVFGGKDDDRTKALIAALDSNVDIVIDADKQVGRQLYLVNSPWVVLVDRQGMVTCSISGYETDTIAAEIKKWLALP